jgi:hypothetical protein
LNWPKSSGKLTILNDGAVRYSTVWWINWWRTSAWWTLSQSDS